MRTIDTDVLSALAAGSIRPFLLVKLELGSTVYRFTDCDVPINIRYFYFKSTANFQFRNTAGFTWGITGSGSYAPRGFSVEPVKYGGGSIVDSVRIEIDDADDYITSPFVGGSPQGSSVTLSQCLMDSDDFSVLGDPVTWFSGEIDRWELAAGRLAFTVAGELVKWAQRPLSKHSATCRWKAFKGDECGYAGAADWCDRTYDRCTALSNTDNFGGFRWLPSIMDKEIWWGRSRAV